MFNALRPTHLTHLLAMVLLGTLLGCGGGGGPTTPAGLPDPGLSNVATENEAARGATVGPGGGAITATGANGAEYSLTIPPGALTADTEIGLYPVTALATLPAGGSTVAAVHFVPEGLRFDLPAELSIKLPAAINPDDLLGLAYEGNGASVGLDLTFVDGQTITMPVLHFSGKALGARSLESLIPESTGVGTRAQILDLMVRTRERQTGQEQIDRFSTLLGNWYSQLVAPSFARIPLTDNFPSRPFPTTISTIISDPAVEYDQWLDGLLYASLVTGQPQETFAPEKQTEGEAEAIDMLRALYQASMELCKDDAVENPSRPIDQVNIATRGHLLVRGMAELWHLPRTDQNGLSDLALRLGSCVQCVLVDPQVTAPQQGVANSGRLSTGVGFSIDEGPVRQDLPMVIRMVSSHDLAVLLDRRVTGTQRVELRFTWPNDVDLYELQVAGRIDTPGVPVEARIAVVELFQFSDCDTLTVNSVSPEGVVGVTGQSTIFFADTDGEFDEYLWDFGGGATTTMPTNCCPDVTLGNPGTYTGSLKITNSASGCSVTHPFSYTVNAPRELEFFEHQYRGTLTELVPTIGRDCEGLGRGYFEFRSPAAGGFNAFFVDYEFDCEGVIGRPTLVFTFDEADLTESGFTTRDGNGTGSVSGEVLSFAWETESGNVVTFEGSVIPE